MSLATLARKTKAKQRVRTRGNFILNMTGRGNVLGMNAKMSRGNCGGKLTKCAGKRAACCVGVPNLPPCVELNNQNSTFTVGFDSPFWGFDAGATGSLVPATIDGSGVEWMGWQTGNSFPNQFYINFDVSNANMPQNHFDSISFVNCNDKSIRTYRTTDASYNAQDPSGSSWPSTGGLLRPTWRWDASTNILPPGGGYSGYTIAQENAYWQGVSGETLKMYIDTVPNVEDICCPKAQCCQFKHGGKPAPQMGYGVYLNRKSKGAYHPGGGPQCCTKPNAKSGKIVWKQGSNLDASVVITNKKDNVLACNSDVYTAKRDTCTGCATDCDDPNNNFTVGYQSAFDFWGYDNTGGTSTGDLVPNTIDGSGIRYMGYQTTGSFPNQFYINFDSSGGVNTPPQDLFNSITFANCNDNSTRTYYTVDASYNSQDPSGYTGPGAGGLGGLGCPTWRWDASTNILPPGGGYSGYTRAEEEAYWAGVSGENLQVYIDNPNPNLCCCKCCPVKKNICGCRATDLVRYTRINKSFGCQTTKAVRMGRTASEQIARNRAKVDCIKPMHRTIYITINANDISFDGCCGDQCLIPGQQYTFVFTLGTSGAFPVSIEWCTGLTQILANRTWTTGDTFTISLTIPKFSSLPCLPATVATIHTNSASRPLDYCKQAFKKPQMLGSCSGR